jgi:hypothetical protein
LPEPADRAAASGLVDRRQEEIMARMGHSNMIAATALDAGGMAVEIGLIGPGTPSHGWAVAVHTGCDPEDSSVGTSRLERFVSLAEAQTAYDAEVDRYRASAPHP